jgi:hypothetical protein
VLEDPREGSTLGRGCASSIMERHGVSSARLVEDRRGRSAATRFMEVFDQSPRCMVDLQILYAVASVAQRSGAEKVGRARLSSDKSL